MDIDNSEDFYKWYLLAAAKEQAFQARANKYLITAHKESDLGLVLLTVSLMDEYLIKILTAFLVLGKHSEDLIAYEHSPIGNVKVRLDLAYALGLIGTEEFKSMNILRKIRNDFAHKGVDASFSNDRIRDLINNMPVSRYLDEQLTIRQKYIFAFGIIVDALDERYSDAFDNDCERPSHLPEGVLKKLKIYEAESPEDDLPSPPSSHDDET